MIHTSLLHILTLPHAHGYTATHALGLPQCTAAWRSLVPTVGSSASALWGPGQPWPSGPLEDHLSCFCLPCPPSAVAVLLCDPARPDLGRCFPARRPQPVTPAQGLSSPLLQVPGGESHSTQHIVALLGKGQQPPASKNVPGLQYGSWNSGLLRKKKIKGQR